MYSVFLSRKPKGVLKHIPEDFVVEEIDSDNVIVCVDSSYSYAGGEGDFLHLVMKKRNFDTMAAVRRICGAVNILEKRVSYAGVKDKVALTSQKVSIYKLNEDVVARLKMDDIALYPVGRGGKIFLGDLWGNRFTVCVRNIDLEKSDLVRYVNDTLLRLDGIFPNYFGEQRFGTVRPVTCPVGLLLLKGDVSAAVKMYLSGVFPGENEGISAIRKIALTDKRKALELFPKSYVYERMILSHLLEHEGDYRGAFMKFPFGLQKMFVGAVQSYIFNEVLKMMIKDGVCEESLKIPLVGYLYGSRIIEDVTDKYVSRVLKREKIDPMMFKMKEFPKLSSKGDYRLAFERFYDFSLLSVGKDDDGTVGSPYHGKSKIVLRFSLPKGCYATVFLSEFFDFG